MGRQQYIPILSSYLCILSKSAPSQPKIKGQAQAHDFQCHNFCCPGSLRWKIGKNNEEEMSLEKNLRS
jgi:hypothetical protein